MVRNKLSLFSFFLVIFLTSLISAATLSQYPSKTVNEEFSFCQVCENSNFITLSNIETPNSTEIINTNMTSTGGGSFCHNYTPTQVGRYDFRGISDGCLRTFAVYVDITPNGKTYNTGESLVYIFISIFFISMMMGFYKLSNSINYEKWYENIKEKYITRNFVKWSLAAIAYNIMTNGFIVYILLGLPIILILTDLTFLFDITSVALYMQSLLYIYIVLIMVLGVVFLSFVQEWFMGFIEDIKNIDWGIDKNG